MSVGYGQLRKIKIEGYKSIKKCDLKLNSINVLIGSNGAGKSNFISALTLLQNVLNKELQFSAKQSGVNTLFYNGRKTTESVYLEVFFNENSYGFQLVPTDDNRIIFRNEFYGFYGRFETQSSIASGHDESKWEIGVGNRIDKYVLDILESNKWRVFHFHDTSRNSKIKQEHNISNCESLMSDASNLAAFLYNLKENYEKSYKEIISTIRLIAPYFKDFVLSPQEGNKELVVLRWKQVGCDDVFNASQFSDGTLRFICLAVLLLQPKELQPATIIVDEPELGLHPYAITIFSEMVKQISVNKQIIISTQSAELLNEFDVNDIVVVDRSDEGSTFKRLNEKELQVWLEEDYSLGELWNKNILGGRVSK